MTTKTTTLEDKITELQNQLNDLRFLNLEADMREKNEVFKWLDREKILKMKNEQLELDLKTANEKLNGLQIRISGLNREAFESDGHIEQ